MDFYELLRGPLAWFALLFFIGGSAARTVFILVRARRLNRLNHGKSFLGGLKSIVRGLVPFGLGYMKDRPLFTLVTFCFHVCVVLTPLFLIAHIVLVYESWKIQWASLPDGLADAMTVVTVMGVLFFGARRLLIKEVKYLTKASDWLMLVLIGSVFVTGFLATHHWGPYRPLLIAHVLTAEILLVTIPFSKLMHMVLFFFTRGYLGAEYEIVLGSRQL